MSEHVETGFEDVAAQATAEPAIPPVPAATHEIPEQHSVLEQKPQIEDHPDGPTVAEKLAAAAKDQAEAERAFSEPIKLLEPEEVHFESEAAKTNAAFYAKLLARRNTPPAVPVPQPVAKRITDQTKLEMAEGARISAIHAERSRVIPRPKPSPREVAAQGTTVPVFRPDDYVPDMNKGYVQVQPLT
jgi:hypothetical protein